jgi:hypothetical protein
MIVACCKQRDRDTAYGLRTSKHLLTRLLHVHQELFRAHHIRLQHARNKMIAAASLEQAVAAFQLSVAAAM